MAIAGSLGRFSPVSVEERQYGSAVFMPMADGAQYQVRITQEGLAVDAENDFTRGLVQGGALRMQPAVAPTPEPAPAPVAP
jgi:hypothetical protein